MIDVPVQVKDALREGDLRKNYRFLVLNDDGTTDFTIDNNNLVKESVSIDERMNSGDKLKYGLCEGSSLEFQYFGMANITGRRVQAFIDIQYAGDMELTDTNPSYTVTEAGSYDIFVPAGTASFDVELVKGGEPAPTIEVPSMNLDHIIPIGYLDVGDQLSIIASTTITVSLKKSDGTPFYLWHTIPMGFFDVKKCSRQASTGIIKATAYNKLQSDYLDAKANEEIVKAFDNITDINRIPINLILNAGLSDYAIDSFFKVDTYILRSTGVYTDAMVVFDKNKVSTEVYLCALLCAVDYSIDDDYVDPVVGRYTAPGTWKFKFENESFFEEYKAFLREQEQALIAQHSDYPRDGIYFVILDAVGEDRLVSFVDYYIEKIKYSFRTAINIMDSNLHEKAFYRPMGYEYTPTLVTLLDDNYFFAISEACTRFKYSTTYSTSWSSEDYIAGRGKIRQLVDDGVQLTLRRQPDDADADLGGIQVTKSEVETWPDVTYRELQSAAYETECQFGQLSRETDLFSGVELNHSRLLPAETLYPDNALYPGGAAESTFRSQYSKLWADEGNIRKWRYLIITYKGLDENDQEADFTLQRTVNADGTDDYTMSDNWLFRNLVWTEEQVEDYADAMAEKMQDITWFPFEMWAAGLPYLETGDEIEIPLGEETYTSYILQRQLKGIQNLQDTYINGTLDIF